MPTRTCDDAFGCVKNTVRLRSGLYFDLREPATDQFTFADIAGALSKICRFGGQCDHFYSVAEHCWHCAKQAEGDGLPLETQQAVLMHDAAEAFTGDMVKPLKVMMPEFKAVEERIERLVAEKFLIDFDREMLSVRKIDHEMLIAERREMFSKDDALWTGESDVRRLTVPFGCWAPDEAEDRFVALARFIGIKVYHPCPAKVAA